MFAIEVRELLPVTPPGERRQGARFAGLPPLEPRPGVARPSAVIDRAAGDLAELAVVDPIDAKLDLLATRVFDRLLQRAS
jgi:hypothetical protein